LSNAADQLALQEIDPLLQLTEQIGTSNPQQFNDNLSILKKYQANFNLQQRDYYDYLVYYQQGYKGQFIDSLKNFNNLFERTQNNEIKFRTKAKIANIHIISGNVTEAINALDYVLNQIKDIDNQFLKQEGYKVASTIYFLLEEFTLSQDFSNLMLNNNPNSDDYCKAVTNIGRIKLKQTTTIDNNLRQFTNDAITACEKIGDFVFSNLLKLDWLKFLLNHPLSEVDDYQSVLDELLMANDEIEKTNYKNLINIKNGLMAETYWKLKKTKEAVNYATIAMEGSQSIGNTLQKTNVLQILAEYYHELGQYETAYKFLLEKAVEEKQHFNNKHAKWVSYQTAKHNNLAKSHEIEFLNQQNQLLSLEKGLAKKSALNQKLFILFLVIITVFILLWGIRNKKVQKDYKYISQRDDLTSIYNRKGLKDYMDTLLPLSEKNNSPISYSIFDLDHFKKINDKYGHIIGDWVIKRVIEQCQTVTDERVTLGRIGGEEFAIVMKDADSQQLSLFAEKCRRKIFAIDTSETEHDFSVSASFGITSTRLSGYQYTSLMTQADKAMYTAKVAGRNMVVDYNENL
jgi:diguanylate cyclase (GGDEF)-like protein